MVNNTARFGIADNGGLWLALLNVGVRLWIKTPAENDAFAAAGSPYLGESPTLAALPVVGPSPS